MSDVWESQESQESQESFEAFGATLLPIMADIGSDPGEPMVAPAHNVIQG